MAVAAPASWPALPARAAYIVLNHAARRNALSRETLMSLRAQILAHNTSPRSGRVLLLPPFRASILKDLESTLSPSAASSSSDSLSSSKTDSKDLSWLTSATQWESERAGLPDVLVLRTAGPVFSAGHDLRELQNMPGDEATSLFALCAEVMHLLRRSPVPVVGRIQGLATAAGCQLALSTDLPVASASSTTFRLPGAALGLPCSSPVTAVSRCVGNALAYRMLALAEPVRAKDLPWSAGVDVVPDPEASGGEAAVGEALDARVHEIATKLTASAPRPQALAKWAFWTQAGLKGGLEDGLSEAVDGDGYGAALDFAGRVMALLHLQSAEAQRGIAAFAEGRGKRKSKKQHGAVEKAKL